MFTCDFVLCKALCPVFEWCSINKLAFPCVVFYTLQIIATFFHFDIFHVPDLHNPRCDQEQGYIHRLSLSRSLSLSHTQTHIHFKHFFLPPAGRHGDAPSAVNPVQQLMDDSDGCLPGEGSSRSHSKGLCVRGRGCVCGGGGFLMCLCAMCICIFM